MINQGHQNKGKNKMKIYTMSSENNCIMDNAIFSRFENDEQATAHFNEMMGDFKIVGWEPGHFSDCWGKFSSEPETNESDRAMCYMEGLDDAVECRVKRPGSHPGLGWWLNPVEDIYVPILEALPEEEAAE